MAAGVKYYKCSLELYKKYSKENRLQDLSFYFTEDKNTKAKALYLGKLLLSGSGVNGNIDINALEATIKNLGNAIIELGTGLDAVNAEIDTVNNEIDQLWVEVDEINVAVQSKVNTETYEAYVSTINSAIEALNAELEETNSSIESKVSKETYDKGMEDLDAKYTEEVQNLWVALDDKVSKETYDEYTAARELTDEEIKEMKATLEGQLSDKVSQNEYSTYTQDRKLTDKGIQTLVDNVSQTVSELSDVIDDKVSAKDYNNNLTTQAQVNTELQEQMGDLSESVKGLQDSFEEIKESGGIVGDPCENCVKKPEDTTTWAGGDYLYGHGTYTGEKFYRVAPGPEAMKGEIVQYHQIPKDPTPDISSSFCEVSIFVGKPTYGAHPAPKDYVDGLIEELDSKISNNLEIATSDYSENDPTSKAYINNRPCYEYYETVQDSQFLTVAHTGADTPYTMFQFFYDVDEAAYITGHIGDIENNFNDFSSSGRDYCQIRKEKLNGFVPDLWTTLADWPEGTILVLENNEGISREISVSSAEAENYLKRAEAFWQTRITEGMVSGGSDVRYYCRYRWGVYCPEELPEGQYAVIGISFPEIKKKKVKKIDDNYLSSDLTSSLAQVKEIQRALKIITSTEEDNSCGETAINLTEPEARLLVRAAKRANITLSEEEINEPVKVSWWKKAINGVSDWIETKWDNIVDDVKQGVKLAKTIFSLRDADISLTDINGEWSRITLEDGLYKYTITLTLEINGQEVTETMDITGEEAIETVLKVAVMFILKKYGKQFLASLD